MTPKQGLALAIGGLVVAALLVVLLVGWNPFAADGVLRLDAADDGTVVELAVGEEIVLRLEGNPTTGYEWQATAPNPAVLAQAGEPEYESSSNDDGSGGIYTFRFAAVGPGRTTVLLHYFPSWEEPTEASETFTFTAVVG
ncbi:MAG: protease inhibitor family protein [Actinobacteria bacterium]|nr:protease inhibitor family protein [Actinomycetota bacterium]